MAQKGRGIFMVYVDIDGQHAPEFNEWYNKEHLPELLSVPGILSAARYEAVKGGPQYLACYELESVAVMQTRAFTNRPRTPWGQKVSPSVIGKNLTRIVGEQIYPDGVEMPERGMAPVLQIGRMSVPAEVDAEWNAWYSGPKIAQMLAQPGFRTCQRFRRVSGSGRDYLALWTLDSPQALATPQARKRFTEKYGIDDEKLAKAIRAGLVRAVDDAEEAGALSPILAAPLRETLQRIPLEQAIELVQNARSLLGNVESFLGPAGSLLEQFLP